MTTVCPECGRETTKGKFCGYCGAKTGEKEKPEPAPEEHRPVEHPGDKTQEILLLKSNADEQPEAEKPSSTPPEEKTRETIFLEEREERDSLRKKVEAYAGARDSGKTSEELPLHLEDTVCCASLAGERWGSYIWQGMMRLAGTSR